MTSGLAGLSLPTDWQWWPLKRATLSLNRGSAPDYVDGGDVWAVGQAVNQPDGLAWHRARFHSAGGDPTRLKGHLRPHDILINSTGRGTLGRVGFFTGTPDRRAAMADGHVTRVRVRPEVLHPRFAYYYLCSEPFQHYIYSALVVGATNQIELVGERLSAAPIALPPIQEQRRIASFLDAELAGIGRTTEARVNQLKLLREREFATIASILGGTDVPGQRRSTGWRWLPTVPSAWTIGPVYAYFDVLLGKMLNAERAAGRYPRPYLRNANVHWYRISAADLAEMSFLPDERIRYQIRKGDLLVCEGGAGVAEAAVWDGRLEECYYQKSLHRVRARRNVPVEWLMYWLRLAKEVGVFASEGNVATIPHLTGEQLRECRIPIPPDGRVRIAELAKEIGCLFDLMSALSSANSLLGERRQSLVTAAVTGQIDVTTARGAHV
ncbi:restriction endonuclease subunit S [Micromonospora sp. CPCC 206171]|uniref:restriction endonuclease subunit S n=1 Tax=Micromonospora sp. CPCC 206171 TaxID=3122405 RepID=UPI002FF21767